MPLKFKSFNQIITDQVQAIQAATSALVDFTIGSILRSMVEGNAGVILWLQGLILKLLATTRASTSTGDDLDTWFADFGYTRKDAISASGNVTYARFTPSIQAVVPIGATIETADGSIVFSVILDTANSNYNSNFNGYVLAAGIASISVPARAVVAGAAGNLAANTLNTIVSPIIAVDTVTNPDAFENGQDKESDANARISFVLYLAALAKADKAAIQFAIDSVAGVVSYFIIENQDNTGAEELGFFFAVIDDGTTGAVPSLLIDSVRNSIEAVRGLAIRFDVYGRTIVTANISAQIIIDPDYDSPTLINTATTALESYINTLPVGSPLRYTRIAQIIYNSSPGIIDVTAVTLNSGTADLTATNLQAVKTGTISISDIS